jgi:hypothetical protein
MGKNDIGGDMMLAFVAKTEVIYVVLFTSTRPYRDTHPVLLSKLSDPNIDVQ